MKPNEFYQKLNDARVSQAIDAAEKRTSGEIRVYVTQRSVGDVMDEAARQFLKLGMEKTDQRNAVLIYFAPKSQRYAVIGDKGVHEKCGQGFWEHIRDDMTPLLKAGQFTEAIELAVREIGEVLAKEFPWHGGDRNERPNQVARDDPPAAPER